MQSSHGDGASTCSRNFSCRCIERPRKSGTNTRWGKMKIRDTTFSSASFVRSMIKIETISARVAYIDSSSQYIFFIGKIWTVLLNKISMVLHCWKISGNLTVPFVIIPLFFFFFAIFRSFHIENSNIFPETETYFKMFTRDTRSLPSCDFEFHSLQSFQSERCQCQLHRERETNQKQINYYTCTKIYILSRYLLRSTLSLTAVLINSNFTATSQVHRARDPID